MRANKLEKDAFSEPLFPVVVTSSGANDVLDASLPFFFGVSVALADEGLLVEWTPLSALQ